VNNSKLTITAPDQVRFSENALACSSIRFAPSTRSRENQIDDQGEDGEQGQIKKFGFGYHNNLPINRLWLIHRVKVRKHFANQGADRN
jgi:hypothetical protein